MSSHLQKVEWTESAIVVPVYLGYKVNYKCSSTNCAKLQANLTEVMWFESTCAYILGPLKLSDVAPKNVIIYNTI